MIKCFRCGKINSNSSNYCMECGKPLKLCCDECGDCIPIVPVDSKFCSRCGTPIYVEGTYRGFYITRSDNNCTLVTKKNGKLLSLFTIAEMKAAIDVVLEYGWDIVNSREWSYLVQTRSREHEN